MENNLTLKCCCSNFLTNANIRVVGKMPKKHFNALSFSNPGDNVMILVESRGQICPIVVTLFFGSCLLDLRVKHIGESFWKQPSLQLGLKVKPKPL